MRENRETRMVMLHMRKVLRMPGWGKNTDILVKFANLVPCVFIVSFAQHLLRNIQLPKLAGRN